VSAPSPRRADESVRQWQLAFERSSRGISITDPRTGVILAANPAFARMHGGAMSDFVGRPLTSVMTAEAALRLPPLPAIAESKAQIRYDSDHVRLDGTTFPVATEVMVARDEQGKLIFGIVWFEDLTEARRAEKALAGAALSFELSRDLMCTATYDGRLDQVNERWQAVLGWTPEELRSREVVDLIHPDDVERTRDEFRRLRAGGDTQFFSNRWRTKGGEWRWLSWSAIADPAEQRVIGTARDVTDAMELDQALLIQAEIARNMAEGVAMIRAVDGNIIYANPKFEQIFGYDPGELDGHPASDLHPPGEPQDELSSESIQERLRQVGVAEFEARNIRKDGTRIWCRGTASTFMHPDYGPVWIAVQRDASDERRAAEAKEAADSAKEEFFAMISHELRTPLTSIIGYTDLIRDFESAGLSGEGRRFLDVVWRNAQRQLRLVDDLLTHASIEAGAFDIVFGPVDPAQVVRDAVAEVAPAATAAGVEVRQTIEPAPWILGDGDRLVQAVGNILANAVKFSPEGGVVEVGLTSDGKEVTIGVDDEGRGISEEEREQLFDPLYRSEDARRRQIRGTGLGLSIAKALIDAHEGTISVAAGTRGGALFSVVLPAPELTVELGDFEEVGDGT
jgi:PAS domain S-box-containing protein